ncbi:hypothetical protein GPECTOR_59g691 [Gonium pectorale]|uniref:Uncharacterized protein n=1 Tax=Gonium pectorale TaxID=33097 RepID=A0A150G5F1_GONPE|nr:hypothetical protein GPECTOR_59g691 [Gonium pectorale]|eukprot:KXZ45082.1 hypothetical protein GPECTOR_59g691 [Gonium pectorale]
MSSVPRAVSHVAVGKAGMGPLMQQGSLAVYRNRRTVVVPKAVLQEPAVASGVAKHLSSAKPGSVVQVYRYPGLSDSTIATLLRKVHEKVTDAITKIDGEQCYNISVTKPLSGPECETLAW